LNKIQNGDDFGGVRTLANDILSAVEGIDNLIDNPDSIYVEYGVAEVGVYGFAYAGYMHSMVFNGKSLINYY